MRKVLLICVLVSLIVGCGNRFGLDPATTIVLNLSGMEDGEEKERNGDDAQELVLENSTRHTIQTTKHNDTSAPATKTEEPDIDVPILEPAGLLAIPAVSWPTAALSPDGQRLVSPLRNDRIAVWNLTSGEQQLVMQGRHDWQIKHVAFSPDGSTVATASMDKTAKLWNANTGKLLATLKGHTDRLEYVTYSPKGKHLFTSTGKTWPYEKYGPVEARIWNARTGELVAELQGHTGTITRAEFSQNDTRVLTASDDHTARVWDAATGKEVYEFELGSKIVTAVFGPDGKTVLASSSGSRNSYVATALRQRPVKPPAAESVVKLWDAMTGKELLDLPHAPIVHDARHGAHGDVRASFNKEGDQILTERRGLITYWNAATGEMLATVREPSVPPPTVILSPNSDFFVVLKRRDQPAELWNVATKKKVREMDVPYLSEFWSMRGYRYFAADGETFYSLDKGEFRWWSLDGIK